MNLPITRKYLNNISAVWINNYNDYQVYLLELEEYGNPNEYLSNHFITLVHENYDFFYGLEAELEELTETHNYLPGKKNFKYIYKYIQFLTYKCQRILIRFKF
jgi:hypothetical protein